MYFKFTQYFLLYVLIGISKANPIQTEEDENDVDGYYWRDYNGEIPIDALPGGTNPQGATTYIGQVLHKEQLIPAKIDSADKQVYYEWGHQEYKPAKETQPVKILCTKHPEQFEWLTTGNGLIPYLQNKHNIIIGGYEVGRKLYIGRIQLKDELAVGKINHKVQNTQSTLHTTKDGKGTLHTTFEILIYNPNLRKTVHRRTNPVEDIDVRNAGAPSNNGTCVQHQITINYFT